MSTSTDRLVSQDSPGERRFYPRITPTRLIYIGFGANNVGMLLNIGENGLLVSTPMGLKLNSAYRVSIRLNGIPNPIEVNVCVVWTTESRKRSGIQLLDLSDFDREQIRKWAGLEAAAREKGPEPVALRPAVSARDAGRPAKPAGTEESEDAAFVPPQPQFFTPPQAESAKVAPQAAKKPARPPAPVFAPNPAFAEATRAVPPRVADPSAAPLAPPVPRQLDFPPSHHLAAIQHTKRRSSIPALVAWGALGATVCGAAAVFFVPSLSQKFLTPLGLHAQAPTASAISAPAREEPAAVPPTAPATPTPAPSEAPAPSRRTGSSSGTIVAANTSAKRFDSKLSASRPVRQNAESSASANDSDSISSAPDIAANEGASALPSKIAPPAPQGQPTAPALAAPANPQATAATNSQPSQPTTRAASSAPGASVSPARSAISGSINGSTSQPTDLSAANRNGAGSTWAGSRSPASAGRSSFVHPNSNSNAGVVNMDPGEGTVTEIAPPRGLLASFMSLPGERVLESPGITMHVQRSVRVPADRWIILHTHKKLLLGKLTSRVDPQNPHYPPSSGTFTVEATIDRDGRVTDIKPLNGSLSFFPGVNRAVREWRYEPTYIDNKPVETRAQIEFDFHPQSARATRP